MRDVFLDNKGFSLVEVLVGFALVGFLALGMADLFTQQARQQAQVQQKANFQQLRTFVQATAADPASIYQSAIQ
ncbi:MAG: prepilin-type N-terminal cleavage/methylation domain-containing protein [Bdellovibrionales bacterium]|nr:prepilin-type N-terminal cleavage/methylation domain-containing protein [Oligoflexia bacterium]